MYAELLATSGAAIKPSPRFAMVLLSLHTMAAIAVCLAEIALIVKVMVFVLVLLSLFFYLARDAILLLPGSWRKMSVGQSGATVVMRSLTSFQGEFASNIFVSPYFVVLRIKLSGRRLPRSRVIFADALEPEEFRELRTALKFV